MMALHAMYEQTRAFFRTWQHRRFTAGYTYAVLMLAPQALCLTIGFLSRSELALINLDLFLLSAGGVLIARLSRTLAAIVLPLGTVFIVAVPPMLDAGVAYLGGLQNIGNYLQFWPEWPWQLFALPVMASLVFSILIVHAVRRTLPERIGPLPFLIAFALGFAADIAAGSNMRFNANDVSRMNIATSSTMRLAEVWRTKSLPASPQPISTDEPAMQNQLRATKLLPSRILSIALESWGQFRKSELNDLLLDALFHDLGDYYDIIESRSTPFLGATLSGEFRQLCGVATSRPPTSSVVDEYSANCIPHMLRERGYFTWAGHANGMAFYDRLHIYPKMGFSTSVFREQLRDIGPGDSICASQTWFKTQCDSTILHMAIRVLESHPRAFAHVMTMDTHLPITGNTSCSGPEDSVTHLPTALCAYLERMTKALQEIAVLLKATDAVDVVYIYGDHRPPFLDGELQGEFSQSEVPIVALARRKHPAKPNTNLRGP